MDVLYDAFFNLTTEDVFQFISVAIILIVSGIVDFCEIRRLRRLLTTTMHRVSDLEKIAHYQPDIDSDE